MGFRSGFAALIGRPNVGKSTLLNALTGEKLSIVSPKPQTTRNRVVGVISRPEGQLALVDTPGVHQAKGVLNKFMVDVALGAASECDVVVFMIEAEGRNAAHQVQIGEGNKLVLDQLKRLGKPTVLVINKVDQVPKPLLLPLMARYHTEYAFAQIVPVSALKGEGIDELLRLLIAELPEGEALFPPEVFTDQAEKTLVAELVREQVLRHCRQEIPYSTAVVVEHFDESERDVKPPQRKKKKGPPRPPKPGPKLTGLVRIAADIYVERESQKAIVIGKRGAMLKQIGTDARAGIERLLGAHVFLSLQVKVEERWSERPDALKRLGYHHEK